MEGLSTYGEQKSQTQKEHVLYGSVYLKLQKSAAIESRTPAAYGE